jgi:hypothetical protein
LHPRGGKTCRLKLFFDKIFAAKILCFGYFHARLSLKFRASFGRLEFFSNGNTLFFTTVFELCRGVFISRAFIVSGCSWTVASVCERVREGEAACVFDCLGDDRPCVE